MGRGYPKKRVSISLNGFTGRRARLVKELASGWRSSRNWPRAGDRQGTGLGLAIVKEVADRHSATIHLDNATPGAGTRCRIIFPTIDKAQ